MHYQYNPNCRPAACTLAFNAASVGTVNIPVALSSAPDEYFLVGVDARVLRRLEGRCWCAC